MGSAEPGETWAYCFVDKTTWESDPAATSA